jgi:3-hydroxybutyryl-CoA dehydrogenase
LELLDQIGLHTHLASSESAYAQLADSRYAPVPLVRQLVRAGALGVRSGRGFYDYSVSTRPRDAQRAVVHAPREDTGVGIEIEGDGAERLAPLSRDGPDPVTVVADGGAYDESHGALVRDLVASGRSAVVESSDAAWAYALPEGAGWVRLHPVHEGWFGERVVDDIAGVRVTEGVQALFAAVGARAVDVPALPGLVADRLSDCLVNEATWVVQERVAAPGAVDIALRLGMNHPLGPFEVLDRARPRLILARLRAMQAASGDPRYRPSSQLQRMAAAEP